MGPATMDLTIMGRGFQRLQRFRYRMLMMYPIHGFTRVAVKGLLAPESAIGGNPLGTTWLCFLFGGSIMPSSLPLDASAASQHRFQLAQELSASCPAHLGAEIAVTGSVSRGVADRFSDIELNFWVDALPAPETARAWLLHAGADAQPLESDAVVPGSFWLKSWYRGVFVETIWQTHAALAADVKTVLAAETTNHWQLAYAWHVQDAVPTRPSPALMRWQRRLEEYPEPLQAALITSATAAWADPHWYPVSIANLWPLAYRHPRMTVAGRLGWEVEKALRVVWAINRRWEPDWKWVAPESRRLDVLPSRLIERIDQIFSIDEPTHSVILCLQLIADVLDLVPSAYDVTRQKRLVREALDPALLPRGDSGSGDTAPPSGS